MFPAQPSCQGMEEALVAEQGLGTMVACHSHGGWRGRVGGGGSGHHASPPWDQGKPWRPEEAPSAQQPHRWCQRQEWACSDHG